MKKVILIPCCSRKEDGGSPDYRESFLSNLLSHVTFSKLQEARKELALILGGKPGPDLGFEKSQENIAYLPAYQRYRGIIYNCSNVINLFPNFKGQLFIISALYGVLDAFDPIRKYDIAMTDSRAAHGYRLIGLNIDSGKSSLNCFTTLELTNSTIYYLGVIGERSNLGLMKSLKVTRLIHSKDFDSLQITNALLIYKSF